MGAAALTWMGVGWNTESMNNEETKVLICPICEEPIPAAVLYGYRENGIWRPSCKDCYVALVNLWLAQKLGQYRQGDPRALLRRHLGIQGKYRGLREISK